MEIIRDVNFEEDCTWKWSREMVKSAGGTFSIDLSYDPTSPPNDQQEDCTSRSLLRMNLQMRMQLTLAWVKGRMPLLYGTKVFSPFMKNWTKLSLNCTLHLETNQLFC